MSVARSARAASTSSSSHIIECEVIGLVGGLLGLALSTFALAFLNAVFKSQGARPDFFRLDAPMVGLSVLLALAAGFVAGAYPAWRTCQLPPALHLKVS